MIKKHTHKRNISLKIQKSCPKVGDAYNNRPVRRWATHYRRDTKNNGPVHWISENYVCPNCVQEPDHRCCQGVPQGLFCLPDSKGGGK